MSQRCLNPEIKFFPSFPMTYFVRVHGNVSGPFDKEQLKDLNISRATEVSLNQVDWFLAETLEFLAFSEGGFPSPIAPHATDNMLETIKIIDAYRRINTSFNRFWYSVEIGVALMLLLPSWILLVGGLVMGFGPLLSSDGSDAVAIMIMGMASSFATGSVLFLLGWTVFYALLLYQLWKIIPSDIARTTPGKAVGFSFIPLFNCYWGFVAWWGLCVDMNKTLQSREIQYRVNENLGRNLCGLNIAAVFFFLLDWNSAGCLCHLLSLVYWMHFFRSVKNGAVAILEDDVPSLKSKEGNAHQPASDFTVGGLLKALAFVLLLLFVLGALFVVLPSLWELVPRREREESQYEHWDTSSARNTYQEPFIWDSDIEIDSIPDVLKGIVVPDADVNAKDEYGWTPLHWVAGFDESIDALKCLVELGADVDTKDEYGRTPLHLAARYNENLDVLRCLVELGADVNAKDEDGKTPLDYATSDEQLEILLGIGETDREEEQ